ncbi:MULTISPECIES: DNA gyrase inhibitor YacG [Methylocaldum]|uniref:DNA gyrase inhibitor YacG n=1 Tax=unclassified Methylocaldum TaxID=2622260 RepID=UPI00098B4165|nr:MULTISPECIES: DNA gyrase inhibitor YacG [unclassified Methylocaldum]MVF21099.1 DNA gyrase inhibitor YacG [Methylocaldum sp. BRCS4]
MSDALSYKIVKCPRCRKPVAWSETHRFKPFCSEYCKLIDLGEWASASYAIAGEPADPDSPDTETPLSSDYSGYLPDP